MGVPEYIYLVAGILAGLSPAVGGLVVTMGPSIHELRLARGLFVAGGVFLSVIIATFGVTTTLSALARYLLVGGSGFLLGLYFYIVISWVTGKIVQCQNSRGADDDKSDVPK